MARRRAAGQRGRCLAGLLFVARLDGDPHEPHGHVRTARLWVMLRARGPLTACRCFCARPYLVRLFGFGPDETARYWDGVRHHDRRHVSGAIRASAALRSAA